MNKPDLSYALIWACSQKMHAWFCPPVDRVPAMEMVLLTIDSICASKMTIQTSLEQ